MYYFDDLLFLIYFLNLKFIVVGQVRKDEGLNKFKSREYVGGE